MRNPFKRKPKPYVAERDRLLEELGRISPDSNRYELVLTRLSELDRILNRTTELKKTVIPAFGTVAAVSGVYALQQFGGVLVPKALETLAARQEQKKHPKDPE
jgi:hypothetical protein